MSAGNTLAVPMSPPRPVKRRRPLPSPAPSERIIAGHKLEVPPGHGAHVYPLATATGFIGRTYSMDSLAFMRWASQRYVDPGLRFVLNVLVACIGLQEVGGMIEKTQQEIGEELGGYSRSHISWALRVLVEDGALRRVRRGVYQLAPSAALRGGMRPLEQGKSGAAGKVKGERVDQLDLLKQILEDPDAPAAFKSMAQADAQLPEGPRPGTKGKAKE